MIVSQARPGTWLHTSPKSRTCVTALRQAVYLQGVIFKISSDNVLFGIAISQLIISLLSQLSVIQIPFADKITTQSHRIT